MNRGNYFPVIEAFRSFQGEGKFLGHPALFLRVKKCNYDGKCPVGCDTIPRTKNLVETYIPYETVLREAKKIGRLVITGGEPTLYIGQVVNLLDFLSENSTEKIGVEIETNGYDLTGLIYSLDRRERDFKPLDIQINWSPKHYSYENFIEVYNDIKSYKVWSQFSLALKIVVWDSIKVKSFIVDLVDNGFSPIIWLMPRGKALEELNRNWPVVVDLALEYGLKVTPRLQIETNRIL